MLENYWYKFVKDLKDKAERGGDRECDLKMIEVCDAIMDIPSDIVTYVIKRFRSQMQKLSWIYLYHTRT